MASASVMDWAEEGWAEEGWAEEGWAEMGWAEEGWAVMDWAEEGWAAVEAAAAAGWAAATGTQEGIGVRSAQDLPEPNRKVAADAVVCQVSERKIRS